MSKLKPACVIALISFLGACGCSGDLKHDQQTDMDPALVLANTSRAYQSVHSYRDIGISESIILGESGVPQKQTILFSTAMSGIDRFRFAFGSTNDRSDRGILWKQGTRIIEYDGWDKTTRDLTNLRDGIASFTGVSAGTACHIPFLLLHENDIGRQKLILDLGHPQYVGDLPADNGVMCHRIAGQFSGSNVVIWIGKVDSLIYRIDESYFGDLSVVQTTKYSPQINSEIPESALKFNDENPTTPHH